MAKKIIPSKKTEYAGKRAKKTRRSTRSVENFEMLQTGAKVLAGMLALLGLNGLFVVYFGLQYIMDSFYGNTGEDPTSLFVIGLVAIIMGLAFSAWFIRLALRLVNAIEFDSRMRIRKVSILSFLSAVVIIIYLMVFGDVQLAGWPALAMIFSFLFGFVAVYTYAVNRTGREDDRDDLEQAVVKKVDFDSTGENPFL